MSKEVKTLKYSPANGKLDITQSSIGSGGLVVKLNGGSGAPTNITGDENISVNQVDYNASLSLNKDLTNINTICGVNQNPQIFMMENDFRVQTYSPDNGNSITMYFDADIGVSIECDYNDKFYGLYVDNTGLYIQDNDETMYYLNFFISTPPSENNPIATKVDLDNLIDIHNDGLTFTGSVQADASSNCIHIKKDNMNIINSTFRFTTTENITDNNTTLQFNGDFTLPLATFLVCYDITTATPQKVMYYYALGTNVFSLINSEANHTYVGTLSFSYII